MSDHSLKKSSSLNNNNKHIKLAIMMMRIINKKNMIFQYNHMNKRGTKKNE
jgi:hypothetical protein